jgi:cytochrome c5
VALVRIRDVGGQDVAPWGGAVAVRIAEARLHDARLAEADGRPAALDEYRGVQASERDLAYLRGAAGDAFYELDCAECHARYLRSLPDLTAAVRRAPSGRVVLV